MDRKNQTDTMNGSDQVQPMAAEARHILEQALLAHWEYRYAKAEELYKQAIAQDPTLLLGRVRYAILLAQQDRSNEAQAQLEQAMTIDPALVTTQLDNAQRQYPRDESLRDLLAFVEQSRANSDSAQSISDPTFIAAEAAVAVDQEIAESDQPSDLLLQAQAETAKGNLDSADILFNQAIQSAPDNVTTYREYAHFLITHQHFREAIEQLQLAQQLTPDDITVQQMLDQARDVLAHQRKAGELIKEGRELLEAGQWEDAREKANLALAELPGSTGAIALKGETITVQVRQAFTEADQRRVQEDYEEAIAALITIQQLLPDDEEILERLNELREEQSKFNMIVSWLDEARQKAQDNNVQAAFELMKQAKELKPQSPTVNQVYKEIENINKAWQLLDKANSLTHGDPDAALELTEEARILAPELENISMAKAKIQAEIEARHQKELEALEKLLRQGDMAAQNGELDQAAKLYAEVLDMQPGHITASEKLKSLQKRQAQVQELQEQAQKHYQAGELNEAKKLLEQAASLGPANSDINQLLNKVNMLLQTNEFLETAQKALEVGRWDEALQQVEMALSKVTESPKVQKLKAEIIQLQEWVQSHVAEAERLVKEENYEAGLVKLDEVLQRFPANEEVQEHKVKIQAKRDQAAKASNCRHQAEEAETKGDYKQAKALWEEVLRLQPNNETFTQEYTAFLKREHKREEIKETVIYPECGHRGRVGAKFCLVCGKPLHRTCSHCKAILRIDARFCQSCGQAVSSETDKSHCKACGEVLRSQAHFCAACGQAVE